MSVVAGIDYSTKAVDVVLLDEDTNHARHHRWRLDLRPGGSTTRIRRIRDQLPARGAWHDEGVTRAAIEVPFARGNMAGQVPLLIALGAILATIPPALPVQLMRADDWRKTCGLPIRGDRAALKQASIDFAGDRWADHPTPLDDNAADAYCIAHACRELARAEEPKAA